MDATKKPMNDPDNSTNLIPFASNEIRLSLRQWGVAAVILVVLLGALPAVWKRVEIFEPETDYRVPAALSEDYWVFGRLTSETAKQDRIPVIGDSVVWGEYVRPHETLSHFLNRETKSKRFVNAGVNGIHPLALEGLVHEYAAEIVDSKVILHLNLLWLSSPDRDLSDDSAKEVDFNHPDLIPQFQPRIPSYTASASDRLGVVVDRRLPVRRWAHHMRVSRFDSLDVQSWSIQHPYENPIARLRLDLSQPQQHSPHGDRPISWRQRGIERQEMQWVALDDSLQWRAFLRTVACLQGRGNRVLVVIGPFNTHLLNDPTRLEYDRMQERARKRLEVLGVAHIAARVLPSAEFADASHPLAPGYKRMAERVSHSPSFRRWLNEP
jgi:hypothetical protein